MPDRATVAVPATNVWTSRSVVRDVDAPMLADRPDLAAWLAGLDGASDPRDGRLGLDGRLSTQLVEGEPVVLLGPAAADPAVAGSAPAGPAVAGSAPDRAQAPDARSVRAGASDGRSPAASQGWAQVFCPWQPASAGSGGLGDDLVPGPLTGYPGWVRTAHLRAFDTPASAACDVGLSGTPAAWDSPSGLLEAARRYLGVAYLWGGCCPQALDCSGLVHLAARDRGIVVPRDAHDQHAAVQPVPLAGTQPGDLLFFAWPGRAVHHVGIVAGPGRMLHAPQTGAVVVEEPLPAERRATLVAAARVGAPSATGAAAGTADATAAPRPRPPL